MRGWFAFIELPLPITRFVLLHHTVNSYTSQEFFLHSYIQVLPTQVEGGQQLPMFSLRKVRIWFNIKAQTQRKIVGPF